MDKGFQGYKGVFPTLLTGKQSKTFIAKKLTSFKNREKPQTLQRMQYSLSSQEYKEKGTQKNLFFFTSFFTDFKKE